MQAERTFMFAVQWSRLHQGWERVQRAMLPEQKPGPVTEEAP
jgi:hypothetical protein